MLHQHQLSRSYTDDVEFDIQIAISDYMALRYPKIIIRMDLGGIRLPIGLAKKAKRLNPCRAWPDIFIAESRGKYHGLFIELKRSYEDLYTKDGGYRKTQHIEEQRIMLMALQRKGYKAEFSYGFEETKNVISRYLDRRK